MPFDMLANQSAQELVQPRNQRVQVDASGVNHLLTRKDQELAFYTT